jgi:hypothetical protein
MISVMPIKRFLMNTRSRFLEHVTDRGEFQFPANTHKIVATVGLSHVRSDFRTSSDKEQKCVPCQMKARRQLEAWIPAPQPARAIEGGARRRTAKADHTRGSVRSASSALRLPGRPHGTTGHPEIHNSRDAELYCQKIRPHPLVSTLH